MGESGDDACGDFGAGVGIEAVEVGEGHLQGDGEGGCGWDALAVEAGDDVVSGGCDDAEDVLLVGCHEAYRAA